VLTPEQRTQRARIAALARWAKYDPQPIVRRGQDGLRARFLREVTTEFPHLSGAELERRAECRYREHMARLAYGRSKAARGADAA
jgi:hypothetical protein